VASKVVAGLIFVGLGAAAAEPVDRLALEAFLELLNNEYEGLTAVRYSFEQVQRVPELTGEIHLTGTVIHRRPAQIRVEARGDENFDLLSDGETVWWVDRDFGDVEEFSLSEARNAPMSRWLPPLLLEKPDRWWERFEVVEFEERGSRRRMVLQPLGEALVHVKSLTLEFRGRRLKQSIARYGDADTVAIKYSDWKRLDDVSATVFRPAPRK
jgi:outer membrane lipoprotein-sorting protein